MSELKIKLKDLKTTDSLLWEDQFTLHKDKTYKWGSEVYQQIFARTRHVCSP